MEDRMRLISIAVGCISTLASACVLETQDGSRHVSPTPDSGSIPAARALVSAATLDTGATMTQVPGDGIGVFVEYQTGGKWRVWWTCDTNKTRQPCDYTVTAHAVGGTTDLVGQDLLGKNVSALSDGWTATSTTEAQAHGLTFKTAAGTALSLSARIAGIEDTNFLFFVQDNKVVGGSESPFANPMSLTPSKP